jgi:hypothetical protein
MITELFPSIASRTPGYFGEFAEFFMADTSIAL